MKKCPGGGKKKAWQIAGRCLLPCVEGTLCAQRFSGFLVSCMLPALTLMLLTLCWHTGNGGGYCCYCCYCHCCCSCCATAAVAAAAVLP
jgi:hypothetical protein